MGRRQAQTGPAGRNSLDIDVGVGVGPYDDNAYALAPARSTVLLPQAFLRPSRRPSPSDQRRNDHGVGG
jgi:hypothetical protein